MDAFTFINNINGHAKKNEIDLDPSVEKDYQPFLTNRALSYFRDTIQIANEMNGKWMLDNKLQHDFLLNIVRPSKRFSKWAKPINSEALKIIQEYYQCNLTRAMEIETLLTPEQLGEIKSRMYTGGVEK